MNWQDQGIIVQARSWGEGHVILSIMTPTHGKHRGLVRHSKKKTAPGTQIGNFISAHWSAKLDEQLGCFTIETYKTPLGIILHDPHKMIALSSACALLDHVLPERHPYPEIFHHFQLLMNHLCEEKLWYHSYIIFELALLKYLGFGLDFDRCAVTGTSENLFYLSPKTGRTVCHDIGKPYANKLFRLPSSLLTKESTDPHDFYDTLSITGFFIEKHFFEQRGLPLYRQQLCRYSEVIKKSA